MGASGDVGTQFAFELRIDGMDIGSFTSCEGLAAEYDVTTHAEGGQNAYEHRLPGRLRCSTLKLSRPIDPKSTPGGGGLAGWFTDLADLGGRTQACKTASITAYEPGGQQIARWNLIDAYPFRWTGPSFAVDGTATVTETLELAHHGFMK